jgi:hypothetical protein
MKKLIIAAFALTAAASVFAQGQIVFNNRISGATFVQTAHVWGPSSTAPGLSLVGIGSNDNPVGTTPFAASGMVMIGSSGLGTATKYGAQATFAQLIGAVGSNQEPTSLVPLSGVTTFRTGTQLGDVAAINATMSGANSVDAPWATIRMVAWDNSSGSYATWAQAFPAWQAGTIAAGMSAVFNVANISGTGNTAPFLTSGGTINGLSFNLYTIGTIPEPSTFALAGMGAAALLIFRRRK